MSRLAVELDNTLNILSPLKAVDLQHEVRRLLQKAQTPANASETNELTATGWPKDFWKQVHAMWGDEPFERPEQLPNQQREEW